MSVVNSPLIGTLVSASFQAQVEPYGRLSTVLQLSRANDEGLRSLCH